MTERKGSFYTGTDLGKQHDYSVIAVIRKEDDILKLVHIKRFELGTPFASVIGYLKVVNERLERVHANYVDCTGLGSYIVEDMMNSGIPSVTGVNFTLESKERMATVLKESMLKGKLKIPFDREVVNELNVERYELTKTGHIQFSHPEGTHDDMFWSVALAVCAASQPLTGEVEGFVFK